MIAPYVWWQSRYDNHAHAFPVAQAAEQERRHYEAMCGHNVTSATVIRRRSESPCAACGLIVGVTVPDRQPVASAATS